MQEGLDSLLPEIKKYLQQSHLTPDFHLRI